MAYGAGNGGVEIERRHHGHDSAENQQKEHNVDSEGSPGVADHACPTAREHHAGNGMHHGYT